MTVATPTDKKPVMRGASADRPVYLDCNATTPVDPRVLAEVMTYLAEEYGNSGSRTHSFGQVAKERVIRARQEIATVVDCQPEEVIFTSGATESDNLAILGLAAHGEATGKKHIVSTQIEHKAVLEPLAELERRGFEVTLVPPTSGGWVEPARVSEALREDTLLVSVMSVNNETGVIQPTDEIAAILADHDAFFHVDAAQAFGKLISPMRNKRIDLMSISGHKMYAPKGVGALVMRRRGYSRPPVQALMFGGGQERGVRPGTLPVALIAGLGLASSLAFEEAEDREAQCRRTQSEALATLGLLNVSYNGDLTRTVPHTLNFSIHGVDSEAAIVALKDLVAVSNGSACTSQRYQVSHVLTASGLPASDISGALRVSWSHSQADIPWSKLVERLAQLSM